MSLYTHTLTFAAASAEETVARLAAITAFCSGWEIRSRPAPGRRLELLVRFQSEDKRHAFQGAGSELAQLATLDYPGATEAKQLGEDKLHERTETVLTLIGPPDYSFGEILEFELPSRRQTLSQPLLESLCGIRHLPAGQSSHSALELYFDGRSSAQALRSVVPDILERWPIDAVAFPSSSKRPRRRLLVFDMDSTLIECEVIDELAKLAGAGEAVAAITARAMRGELDFQSSFRERMRQLRGLSDSALQEVAERLPVMPGAESLFRQLRALGHHTAILSGGFGFFASYLQGKLGISEVHANHLDIQGGVLSGEVVGTIVDGEQKLRLLREIAEREEFDLADTVAVGDGANDLPMISAAGLGVAFHAKPIVQERSPAFVNRAGLDALIAVLGVSSG
ncbi:MAG: phosphoserine phosphatase SerB [Pseudomonadota bacterium]